MIIWLASYPKSGNTLLRSLISAYFFSDDGKFEFNLLKNIIQFPNVELFKKYGVNIEDDREVIKNYINIQNNINKANANTIKFIKTHSAPYTIEGNSFTNLENTLGVIYIVRDPRSVVKSFSNHYQLSIEDSTNSLLTFSTLGGKINSNLAANKIVTHLGTWSSHYNTWKEFKKVNKYMLVRYEDLIKNTEEVFLNILEFIHGLKNLKFTKEKNKFKNCIETTSFKNLQNIENNSYFPESIKTENNEKINFFKYGPNNEWKNDLPKNLIETLEKKFQKEMIESGYLEA